MSYTPEAYLPIGGSEFHTSVPFSLHRDLPELFATVAEDPRLTIEDCKALSDSWVIGQPEEVVQRYRILSSQPGFDGMLFFTDNFRAPQYGGYGHDAGEVQADNTGLSLSEYISKSWVDLTYHVPKDAGTLIGTKHPHLKAGERYAEGYYWDLENGLQGIVTEATQTGDPELWKLAWGVVRNCADLIDIYGFVPNGLRTYYLTRSQPPKFTSMVKLLAAQYPEAVEEFLPQVTKEYNWWMKGEGQLDPNKGIYAADHVLLMPDGSILNRYWDTEDTPRPEGRRKDIETARRNPNVDPRVIYRNLRIMAESGRDFTAEYLEDAERLETAYADRIAPVDLNPILWEVEDFVAQAHDKAGRSVLAAEFRERADARADAINKYLWTGDDQTGYYCGFLFDPDFKQGEPTRFPSMTMTYAVARDIAPSDRSESVCRILNTRFMKRGGYIASLVQSGEQWDDPNAWAPDQDEADKAQERTASITGNPVYAMNARVGRARWVGRHAQIYRQLGTIVEKCNAVGVDPLAVQDGEYPLQRGFLWTNGILRKFLTKQIICPTLFVVSAGRSDLLQPRRDNVSVPAFV